MVLVLPTFDTVLYYFVTTFIKYFSYKLLFLVIFTFPCIPKLIPHNVKAHTRAYTDARTRIRASAHILSTPVCELNKSSLCLKPAFLFT